jgi:hypothetical protein
MKTLKDLLKAKLEIEVKLRKNPTTALKTEYDNILRQIQQLAREQGK